MKRCKLLVGVVVVAVLAPWRLSATPITGSIAFEGQAHVNDSITAFTSYSDPSGTPDTEPTVKANWQIGDYADVTAGTAATWTPFTFNPPAGSVTPLWNMSYGGRTYSFSATSMAVSSSSTEVDISGTGIAHITGFDDTYGTWTVTATGGSSVVFTFGATTTASGNPVPDGGTTILLLGLALAAIAMLGRKAARPVA